MNIKEPRLFRIAQKDPRWCAILIVEFQAFVDNHTWELVPHPSRSNVISCKCAYKIKRKLNGLVDPFKASIVARGFN